MIRISSEELGSGLDLSRRVCACRSSHNCLWMKRTNLFTGFLPRTCLKENCPVVIFRQTLEDDSPAYYAEALKLSQWYCVSSLATIDRRKEIERAAEKKGLRPGYLRTAPGASHSSSCFGRKKNPAFETKRD